MARGPRRGRFPRVWRGFGSGTGIIKEVPGARRTVGAQLAPCGGRTGTLDSEALAHLVPRATYIEPRVPIRALRAVLPARSRLRSAKALGLECQGLAGAGAEVPAGISASAEPRRAGQREGFTS